MQGGGGREGGKGGVSQHAAPLGRWPTTSEALPSSRRLGKQHVVKGGESGRAQTFITLLRRISGEKSRGGKHLFQRQNKTKNQTEPLP